MFTDHHPNWTRIIIAIIALAAIGYSIILFIFREDIKIIMSSLLKIGFVISAISLIWYKFEKSWWSIPIFQCLFVNTPDLSGRWVGKYVSSFDEKERDLRLEIRQTLLSIECFAFTCNNKSESYSSHLLSDKLKTNFKLAWIPMQDESLTDSQFKIAKRRILIARMLILYETYKHTTTYS
jgi:hypothetical protein